MAANLSTEDRLARLEGAVDQLQSREEIRERLYSYARAVDRGDLALLRDCYHPGAKDIHWVFIGDATAFADYIMPQMQQYFSVRHCITNIKIEIDGERAFVESQYWAVLRLPCAEQSEAYIEQEAFGRYLDIWERRSEHSQEAVWKIAFRRLVDDGASVRRVADQGGLERVADRSGQPDRSDPVYLGFGIDKVAFSDFSAGDMIGQLRKMFDVKK